MIEVLESCLEHLEQINSGDFICVENQAAIENLKNTISQLNSRKTRRSNNNTLGTHIPDTQSF